MYVYEYVYISIYICPSIYLKESSALTSVVIFPKNHHFYRYYLKNILVGWEYSLVRVLGSSMYERL
jgi:hypothetical protein